MRSIGVDPGYGSSPFGVIVNEYIDGKIRVLYSEEFPRPDYNIILQKVYELYRTYNQPRSWSTALLPHSLAPLKTMIGERSDFLKEREEYKARGIIWDNVTKVLPIYFGKLNKSLLGHAKNLFDNELIQIHRKHDKLIIGLRSASEEDGKLDKDKTSYNDIIDAFFLSLYYFQLQ